MKNFKNHKRKCLRRRFTFSITITTFISIAIMIVVFLTLVNRGLYFVGTQTSEHFADQIEQQFSVIQEKNTFDSAKSVYENVFFQREMNRLSSMVPILDFTIELNDTVVFHRDAEQLIRNSISKGNNDDFDDWSTFSKEQVDIEDYHITRIIYNNKGISIGSIHVGIDRRLYLFAYSIITISLITIGLIVLLFMKFLTTIFAKPILNPLKKLQNQLDLLADENYENVNPSLIIDNKTVSEVADLAASTNKLLKKMVNYNEVITQSEKMASIGQLTAAITHEINTPLGVINANTNMINMLIEAYNEEPDIKAKEELFKELSDSAKLSETASLKIKEIIKSLRSFSRIDQADFMPSDINESIDSVITLTTNLHKNRIEIEKKYGILPKVSCFISLINQVFMNVIINAIQSIESKGKIIIETTSDELFVYVKIVDTGCGIQKKDIYRVFEYGYTTKQPGSGSGIGLALSNNIMKKHNGKILIDSVVGEGTSVLIKLPIDPNKEK